MKHALEAIAVLVITTSPVQATDMYPRAYSNIPKNINFLLAGYANMKGDVAFSPAIPIDNAKLATHTASLLIRAP